ncbi:hypothetical protein [Chitinophaga pinensis]|uniref:Uncharacterized protein n=1 Tax=Chitinophaga pinensis (strain ATCC 43595 / DSM 2588 / LMG 13176 / NBRC 15968 / NCIMB 11800 / UQM 2034) TaxID=485918 RepID=A0A979G9P1_CHIPD|nr:hypothetical protein [Chitinophaga pinensis]ACU63298.1 hypothetical protein Cpin_5880 [Chitinophaga pinensis DSM 2588]
MSWNYSVIKRKSESGAYEYGLHEVFYNEKGEINFWTIDSLVPVCPSEEGLKHELQLMLKALKEETIVYDEL